jgi:hypothetical protein
MEAYSLVRPQYLVHPRDIPIVMYCLLIVKYYLLIVIFCIPFEELVKTNKRIEKSNLGHFNGRSDQGVVMER